MEILLYSKVLSEHSSVEHIRNDNPEETWDTRTLYVYSTNIEPEYPSCRAVLGGYFEVFEEAGGGEREGEEKKKKNYNFATLEKLQRNSALVLSWKRDILSIIWSLSLHI